MEIQNFHGFSKQKQALNPWKSISPYKPISTANPLIHKAKPVEIHISMDAVEIQISTDLHKNFMKVRSLFSSLYGK